MEYSQSEHWLSEEDGFAASIHLFDLRSNCSTISSPSVSPVRLDSNTASPAPAQYQNQDEMHSDPFFTPTCPGWYNYTPPPPNHSHGLPAPPGSFSIETCTPFCTPRLPLTELAFHSAEPTHLANGVGKISRRRAQNRAAQRAFRERKEKRAKDIEVQLVTLTERYRLLESSHAELSASYEKMRKAMEVLTRGDREKLIDDADTVRDLLGVLCGEFQIKEEK
ncbi:hypothetical protein H2199_008174 [Coniosporium tulheliwenetii]|uniref:Uncharacterized protein n=1 Tax=Coniosporium tulheliwenetii TaxID=3383036 RepID=A0ACC2YKM5_9PEZI|nr:hypothetical protein H2199_008174 [Cladosporium sp. JES 115]